MTNIFPSSIPRLSSKTPSHPVLETQDRTGMSAFAWKWVFNIVEAVTDFIKGGLVIGGVIAINVADFLMGSIGISFLMSPTMGDTYKLSAFGFGAIISLGSSAIQIYMWSLIQRRGIKVSQLFHWKRLPADVQSFLSISLFLWVIDTFLDASPLAVLFSNSMYADFPIFYGVLVFAVTILVVILCGFAELLTSNIRNMLMGNSL